MINLQNQKVKGDFNEYDKKDLLKLQRQLFIKRQLFCTLNECANIWQTYSGNLGDSWLSFPRDEDQIVFKIESDIYFESYQLSKI